MDNGLPFLLVPVQFCWWVVAISAQVVVTDTHKRVTSVHLSKELLPSLCGAESGAQQVKVWFHNMYFLFPLYWAYLLDIFAALQMEAYGN